MLSRLIHERNREHSFGSNVVFGLPVLFGSIHVPQKNGNWFLLFLREFWFRSKTKSFGVSKKSFGKKLRPFRVMYYSFSCESRSAAAN